MRRKIIVCHLLGSRYVVAKGGIPASQIFKALVLRGDKTRVRIIRLWDLKFPATASGNKKGEMVPVKDSQALTGYIEDRISPLGVKKNYPIYMDKSVEDLDLSESVEPLRWRT